MSVKKSKKYNSKMKAKVVLEVMRNDCTVAEVASKYDTHPKNIQNWRKEFLENVEVVFEKDRARQVMKTDLKAKQDEIDELHRQNGKINAQLEWAKKKVAEYEYEHTS